MGISSSSSRRNHNHHHRTSSYYSNPPHAPPYFYPSSSSDPSSLPLPPPPTPPPPPPPPPPPATNYVYVSGAPPPYPTTQYQYQYQYPPPIQSNYYPNWGNNSYNYRNPLMGPRPNFPYHGAVQGNGWAHMRPTSGVESIQPPPYVEHQSAKVVKNDVNVHKDTIRLEIDEDDPDHYLVSFIFDATFDGSITIYYFAKEEDESCKFTPTPEGHEVVTIPFQKGAGQRFRQPSGTGVDLGFFELEALGKLSKDDVFPLVIVAQVSSSSHEDDEGCESLSEVSPRIQATQAVIEKKNDGSFQVKVIRQILRIDGARYELRELYGIGNSSAEGFNDDDPGKECVICMTERKNTAVMPCRHLCLCSDCAKELRLQTNKCPICRQPITELIEIKINDNGQ